MIVKVCGMCDSQNIHDVARASADLIGMIFYDKSPRFVNAVPDIPKEVKRIGVFVNDTVESITAKAHDYGLDMIQLHGNETPEFIRSLRAALPGSGIIKAISISTADDLALCSQYEDCADMLLFDTKCISAGGSGRQFSWSILNGYHGTLPFLLSGGIGPGDAPRIADFHHPMMVGVDINSRFETEPGIKDSEKIRKFIKKLRNSVINNNQ